MGPQTPYLTFKEVFRNVIFGLGGHEALNGNNPGKGEGDAEEAVSGTGTGTLRADIK